MNEVEEVSLYELIMMITKEWKTILITAVITIGLSIGVYVFYNQPSYESQSTSSIIFYQNQYTDLGEYTFPYSKAEDFIKILKNEDYVSFIASKTKLDKSIISSSITYTVKDLNKFVVKVSNSNSDTTNIILKTLLANNEDYLNYYLSDEALVKLNLLKTLQLKSLNKNLDGANRVISFLEIKLDETNLYLGSNINPEYSSLINILESRKTAVKEIEFNISDIEESLKLIDAFNSNILSFEDYLILDSKLLISDLKLKYDDVQSFESYRFIAKTLFPIAALLGIMLGIFIVFFKRYWTSNSQANTSN